MPSVTFDVAWPDGERVSYYSPSTVVHQYIQAQTTYSQSEFSEKIFSALDEASERVYQKFGYYCSAASSEKNKIERKLENLSQSKNSGSVKIVEIN